MERKALTQIILITGFVTLATIAAGWFLGNLLTKPILNLSAVAQRVAGGDLTAEKIGELFDRWPEAAALGEKMDFVHVAMGDERSHAILAAALKRGKPVCGHIYGREFVAAGAASGITDTHESIDPEIASDFLEAGLWIFLRGGNPATPWHSLPLAIQAVTRAGANPKRVCVCTDDRDADDLFLFGLDWVVREAVKAGVTPLTAWSMGSLHPATRYGMDGEFGALGHGRRADIVLLDDALKPRSTWYGGVPVVDEGRITPVLEAALSDRYRYPAAAYRTVHFRDDFPLIPALPSAPCTANILRVALPGIITFHDKAPFEPAATWKETLTARPDLCFVTVVERHGKNGGVGHGLLKDFGLAAGAVASTVGHDAHNLSVAGRDEADMRLAVETLKAGSAGTIHCLELAKAHGARFFLASTSEVYGDPLVHPQVESYWGNVNPVGPRSMYD
jgi:adenine deaminase